jgi:hypothetical protein
MPMKHFFYKHGVLLIGLTPVLVYCLSCLLFEANADSAIQFKKLMLANISQAAATPALLVAEYKARVLWQCSSVLSISAYIMAILWSCSLLYRCCQSGAQVKKILLMGSVIVSLTLLQVMQASPSSAIYNVIFSSTYEALDASPLISDGFQRQVYVVICLINLLAAMTPVFILVAVCSTFSMADHAEEPELHLIVERIGYLKQGVVAGSIVLLFGIVHMVAWLEWPKALLGESAFAKVYLAYVHANSQYWGLTFTLLLLSIYFIAMWALNSRVADALEAFPDTASKQKWLNDNSLTMTFQKHALQLGMMLMPTLAGAFDSVLESL